jgi:hypothetical protein
MPPLDVMANYTPKQGRYLAYINAYTELHGYPPAESEIATAMCVSAPSVNTMVKMLEKKGLILRQPGKPRSLKVIVPADEIPSWNKRGYTEGPTRPDKNGKSVAVAAPPANLYVFTVYLKGGPVSEKFTNKPIYRTIEIRGDQTLEQLHLAIFAAFEREDEHLYEFQLGKRPYDPDGPNYGIPETGDGTKEGDARITKVDDLNLKEHRVFGYLFDFGDEWYHQVQLERIEKAIPTVTYPRVIKRVGKSPPQYSND